MIPIKVKIMIIVGTRPEWIKAYSTINELKRQSDKFETIIVNTGQHIDMGVSAMKVLNLTADINLDIMKEKQTLSYITTAVLNELDSIVKIRKPDVIVVVGDTTTAFAGALCAFYNKIKLVHIESGARSYNKYCGFPEEMNRRMIDELADLNLCQNEKDLIQLKTENIYNGMVVGNTSLDAVARLTSSPTICNTVLITTHRRENWEQIPNICKAIKILAEEFKDYTFIIPRHPNPVVYKTITNNLNHIKNVELIDNLPFDKFINLLSTVKLVISDSGGLVQESLFLEKPFISLRENNEYEEYFDDKYTCITGTNTNKIVKKARKILLEKSPRSTRGIEFGNGQAYVKIVEEITKFIEANNGRN